MEQTEVMEMQLWAYIDNLCTDAERQHVESLIAYDDTWKHKYQELLSFHNSLQKAEPEHPSMRFTQNVMDAIASAKVAPATRTYVNPLVVRGMAALLILLLGSVITYFLLNMEWSSTSSVKPYNYNGIFSGNFVLYVVLANILLLMIFIDAMLKRRKRMNSQ